MGVLVIEYTHLVHSRLEGGSLPLVLHQQEIVWCSTLVLMDSNHQCVVIVGLSSRVIELDRVVKLTLDLSHCLWLEGGALGVACSHLDVLAADTLHHEALPSETVCSFTMVVTRSWVLFVGEVLAH